MHLANELKRYGNDKKQSGYCYNYGSHFTLVLLVFFIPVAKLIPGGTGLGLLYTLYIGYLIMELQSILENYKKMGINTAIFSNFIEKFKNNGKEE